MKILIISFITFLTGLAIGVAVMQHVSGTKPNQALAIIALGDAGDKAMYGTLLHDKRYDELQNLLEQGMYSNLDFITKVKVCNQAIEPATSFVQGYYDATGRPIPAKTIELLKSVPTVKGASIRRLVEIAVSAKK